MKTKSTLLTLLLFALFAGNINAAPSSKTDACDLRSDMRQLWEEHVMWTRLVILGFIDSLPGTNEAVARLLQNQVDIGNAIKPYYGEAAGNQLTALLTNHILEAANLLTDLISGNTTQFAIDDSIWYRNADSIALFLSTANPNWSYTDLHNMMIQHLDLTTNEVVAAFTGDYAGDVAAFDAIEAEILQMSDMLTNGIIAQFHNKFSGKSGLSAKKDPQEVVLDNLQAVLEQNEPNPFSERTTISYTLPETVADARIEFRDINGRVIKSVALEQTGEAQLTVITDNLSKGFYTYSVVADGKVIDTKRMIRQ
jgi:hypothetical protein